jgi:aerobic-type carbon monoxide dehydrogenase small subunit (CoxS/CutS family)
MKQMIHLVVNGETWQGEIEMHRTLLEILRGELGLTGTKSGCGMGECCACTVIKDGEPVLSCLLLAVECNGCHIETVEGLTTDGCLHPLQQAFLDHHAVQCGFCTPGFLMAAKALLNRNPNPGKEEIMDALKGHICRCTGYESIISAVQAAASDLRKKYDK